MDGTKIYITPLKIRYLKEFMVLFDMIKEAQDEDDAMFILSQCVTIAMQQYYPEISTVDQLEDSMDIKSVYKVLDVAAGVKINKEAKKEVKEQALESITWDTLDLANLESEVFQLGIWKDYQELELSLSMPELMATLNAKRQADYEHKKFLAAIQGVDLEKDNKQDKWQEMKARVFSKGKTSNGNDVTALQGPNAQKAGFGIGMGLDYQDMTKK
jgi:translation initiation factor 1 (eIF-1/SUI1)